MGTPSCKFIIMTVSYVLKYALKALRGVLFAVLEIYAAVLISVYPQTLEKRHWLLLLNE
ncbi:hypothetical protein HNQ38_002934, partial [Desulfovibrio intestinalis]|nr:hypothetical protein [Desulfovibrio intestinalis]